MNFEYPKNLYKTLKPIKKNHSTDLRDSEQLRLNKKLKNKNIFLV